MKTTTTIDTGFGKFTVFNVIAQRSHATAYNIATSEKLQIGGYKERLDMSDTDDIESRIISALAWKQ